MKELVQKEVDRIRKDMDRAKASSSSNQIFNELVAKRVLAMFEHLDVAKTGSVEVADPTVFASQSAEVKKLFDPFVRLLSSKEQPVDFETFEYLFKKFIRVDLFDQNLNVEERRVVLSLGEEKKRKTAGKNPNLTFKVGLHSPSQPSRSRPDERKWAAAPRRPAAAKK
jgi:hypothetical protein